jgi:hypothetical protein
MSQSEQEVQKNPIGRPSHYSKDLCEKIIPFFKEGMSVEEICLELDICTSVFYDYIRDYPEFSDAVKRGRSFSVGWWHKIGRLNLPNKDFNSRLYDINVRNRIGWNNKSDMTEKVESLLEKVIDKL